METHVDPKRVVTEAYDRMGPAFDAWNSRRPPAVRRWFLGEVLARVPERSAVVELGCGPGNDSGALSAGRRYVGVDLSAVQLSIAREHAPTAAFVCGDDLPRAVHTGADRTAHRTGRVHDRAVGAPQRGRRAVRPSGFPLGHREIGSARRSRSCVPWRRVIVDPRHPTLLGSTQVVMWGSTEMRFVFEPLPPDPDLIANVRCACFSGDRVLVIDTQEFGLSAFPGGTLEPGELWTEALERELLEEAGAHPSSVEVVGRIHFWSGRATPYRPHLPHPEFQWVVAHSDVELIGRPSNPPDGEHVRSVVLCSVDDAVQRLRAANPFEAELLSFVAGRRVTAGREERAADAVTRPSTGAALRSTRAEGCRTRPGSWTHWPTRSVGTGRAG